jgi:hypothetical protein
MIKVSLVKGGNTISKNPVSFYPAPFPSITTLTRLEYIPTESQGIMRIDIGLE